MAFVHFSTKNFPIPERLEAAQDIYAAMAHIDVESLDKRAPEIETKLRLLPGLSIGCVTASKIAVHRTEKHIRDGNDDFSLLLNPPGRTLWSASIDRSSDHLYQPGLGCLSFGDRPGTIVFRNAGTRLLNLNVSRKLFEPLVAGRNKPEMQPYLKIEVIPLLIQCVDELMTDSPLSCDNILESTNRLVELAALAVGASSDFEVHARQNGLKQARLKAVKADLLVNAGLGELSLDWVSKRHGISPSYVRALFEQEGISFTEYLLKVRLQRAYDCLLHPAFALKTITDIAYLSGFNNVSWFYKAFKQRFGIAPGELR